MTRQFDIIHILRYQAKFLRGYRLDAPGDVEIKMIRENQALALEEVADDIEQGLWGDDVLGYPVNKEKK